jgi:hypothetical protein
MLFLVAALRAAELGINNQLFHITVTVQSFDLFIHIIGAMILLLTGFSPESTDLFLSVALVSLGTLSKNTRPNDDALPNYADKLPSEHIEIGGVASVINRVLQNQKVSITEEKLKDLLNVKSVEFDLPITKDTRTAFTSLTGKSVHKGFAGVYVFTHIPTGSMYVGSSNLLNRRLEYYFKDDLPKVGKLLPLISRDGLGAFKLKIYKLDPNKFRDIDALFLEQYFLLDKEYGLNTLRVVNFGPQLGKSVFIYDLNCKILYYSASSSISLKRKLGIHQSTCSKYVNSKIPFLGSLIFLSFPILSAVPSRLSESEFLDLLDEKRQSLYDSGARGSKSIILEIKEENKLVDKEGVQGNTLEFDSLTSCISYLRSLGLKTKRDTLSKYIKEGKPFKGFIGKFYEKTLLDSSVSLWLDHLIKEYERNVKQLSVLAEIPPINKKNKALVVKSLRLNNDEIKTFDSIMNAVRYFDSLDIKLDRKSLNVALETGKPYKDYTFQYKRD